MKIESQELRLALDAVAAARSALADAESNLLNACMKHAREKLGAPAEGDFIVSNKDGQRYKVKAAHHRFGGDITLACQPFKKDGEVANVNRYLDLSELLEAKA